MQTPVELIKEKLGIEEVVGGYVTLEKSGGNFKARCPFHHEKTPSFFVSPDRGSFYCFGCGAKGDIFSFVELFEGVDFRGALELLAGRAGVSLERNLWKGDDKRERLYRVMEAATAFYELHLSKHKAAKEYLLNRGLSEETISSWRLGYAPLAWRDLYELLLQKGVSQQEMVDAGLVKVGEKGTVYDRFRGRIMFPLFDASSRVIGFSGRILVDEKDAEGNSVAPKYLNSPETALFHKSEVLYGLHKAKRAMRALGKTILVEGQMDLLMAHQAGFENTLATSGTALTPEHIDIIRRFSDELLVAYDADNAGRKASERVFMIALEKNIDVKFIKLAEGVDPADCLKDTPEEFKQALENTTHIIDISLSSVGNDRDRIAAEVLPLVASLGSTIEQASWVGKIAHLLKLRDESVWDDMKRMKQGRRGSTQKQMSGGKFDRRNELFKRLMAIKWRLLQSEAVEAEEIDKRLKEILGQSAIDAEAALLERKEDILFQSELLVPKEKLVEESREVLREIEIEHLQSLFKQTMQDLTLAENTHDKEKAADLLLICQSYAAKISLLKRKPLSEKQA